MRLMDLMGILWGMRKAKPSAFNVDFLLPDGRRLLGLTLRTNIGKEKATLYYRDQHPKGKSLEASLVRRRALKTNDVGWLWAVKDEAPGKRVWLAKVVKGNVEILPEGTFLQKRMSLIHGGNDESAKQA